MVAAWIWMLVRAVRGKRLFPKEAFFRLAPATWGVGTILFVMCLYVGSSSITVDVGRALLGIKIEQLSDREDVLGLSGKDQGSPAQKAAEAETKARRIARVARDTLILNAAINLVFLALLPWTFRKVSGSTVVVLGLTTKRWTSQIGTGVVAALVATPAIYLIQFLALRVYESEPHPVQKMLTDHFDATMALFAILSTVVLAPLVEETFFRGILQGWLTAANRRAAGARPRPANLTPPPSFETTREAFPDQATESLDPSVASAETAANQVCWPAVVAASLPFAALHIQQWPTPIPLFFFSIVLGAVYQKTGSLLTAMVVHGLFNGCSTMMMIAQQLSGSLKPPGEIDALPLPEGVICGIWKLAGQFLI
ncbi:CPBP family intramembrane glutamic endopeptidase [Paludisphaera mucosa]|uniref:CPBP family intramembrane metalloprotease n=1 Tax=Paludisphaera mucosa TaxID=3030827 RepID=A0ABT6F6A0_9BACT|nr:CPBP family intramembrane glutamic endopeptidase [Paludisphaera mucosa]MDG3003123.1 CPBP family intramembrane metalloprotease [Paludisphaera mucosa]